MGTIVNSTITLALNTVEQLSGVDLVGQRGVVHSGFDTQTSLTPTTTPPASKISSQAIALVAGAATIDLTSLPGADGATFSGNGLRVQAVKFQNPASNLHVLKLQPGGSNAYNLFGPSFVITISPGDEFVFRFGSNLAPVVGSGAKNLALSDNSAGGTDTHNVEIILG